MTTKTPLREIKKKTVITITPTDTVIEAAMLMKDKDVGSVVVVNDRKPVGIITDRDIAIRVVAEGIDAAITPVEEVMTKELITANDSIRTSELLKLIDDNAIRRIPFVDDDGNLAGIITLDDILQMVGINVGVKMKLTGD